MSGLACEEPVGSGTRRGVSAGGRRSSRWFGDLSGVVTGSILSIGFCVFYVFFSVVVSRKDCCILRVECNRIKINY